MVSTKKEKCRTLYRMLDTESGKLIRRMVSVPPMDKREINGVIGLWNTFLSGMEDECNCKSLRAIGKDVESALRKYERGVKMKGKRGSRARSRSILDIGGASVRLSEKVQECKII